MRRRSERRGRVGVVAHRMLLAAFGLSLAACGGDMTFDSASWRKERGNATGESARSAMAASLDGAGIVVGATREKVRDLLGPPDGSDEEGDLYFLGRSDLAPDYETLTIRYGPENKVTAIDKAQS